MDISERNKNNIMSRWKKVHQKDIDYINKIGQKFPELKARVCGFIAGDGNILVDNGSTCRHNTVRFFPDHKSMIESFNEAMIKVYNKKPKINAKKNYFEVTLDSKPIVNDLLEIGKFGTMSWEVPKVVFKSNKNKIEWLRAFFDCEAYIHDKHIRVKSVNKKGLAQVKRLLDGFGIHSKIYVYEPKNKKHKTNYMLTIYRKNDRIKYLNLIGFNHTIKLKRLNNVLNINAEIA